MDATLTQIAEQLSVWLYVSKAVGGFVAVLTALMIADKAGHWVQKLRGNGPIEKMTKVAAVVEESVRAQGETNRILFRLDERHRENDTRDRLNQQVVIDILKRLENKLL